MRRPAGSRVLALLVGAIAVAAIVRTPMPAGAEPIDDPDVPAAADEAEVGPEGSCDLAPGVMGGLCDGIGGMADLGVGAVVGGGVNAVLDAMVAFVVEGAGWLLTQLAAFIDSSTSPDLDTGWFRAAYADMALIGMLGLLPFLLLALLQALIRQDVGMMLRSAFGHVPLAAIGTAGAIVVADLLVRLTDQLSGWIARGLDSDLSSFATGLGGALARMSLPTGGAVAGLAALTGAALVAFAAFVIWLELLLRQAAIHVAVLFLPLGFMALVWPATAHWLRRLVQGLVAIILSKFVIVAVMALAANALDTDVADDGFGVVMSGGALLGLAALAPYVLLRLIPVFDAGMSSELEGTFRRPTAAVGNPVRGRQVTGLIRQRVGATASPGAPVQASTAAGGAGATGVGLAAAGVVAGARGVSSAVGRHADGVGEVAAAANGSPTRRAGPRPPSNGRARPPTGRSRDGSTAGEE